MGFTVLAAGAKPRLDTPPTNPQTHIQTQLHTRKTQCPSFLSEPDWESVPIRRGGGNQNKWSPLKAAMHQLLDKVINKQAGKVID